MFIDRAGLPFIVGALALALIALWFGGRWWALPMVVMAAFFVFFFRDPNRTVPTAPGLVVAPGDGRVMIAGDAPGPGAPAGEWRQISLFLSPMDVHVNRTPVEGRVTHIEYHPGEWLPAYRIEAGHLNEWSETWFVRGSRTFVCRQIVGMLARRVVNRLTVGDEVTRGQRYGVMKFGSRIDLYVPPDFVIAVTPGDKVVAGETVLAREP
ncbi:MAG: phosphatidylserine decarboxylase family protein [Acidobacteria bacterium]|nr:phosphatidylserine decarboxylase family protein [Acidobacteriota bacterium]